MEAELDVQVGFRRKGSGNSSPHYGRTIRVKTGSKTMYLSSHRRRGGRDPGGE